MDDRTCTECGKPVLYAGVGGQILALDLADVQERYVVVDGIPKWTKTYVPHRDVCSEVRIRQGFIAAGVANAAVALGAQIVEAEDVAGELTWAEAANAG